MHTPNDYRVSKESLDYLLNAPFVKSSYAK